MSKALLWLTLKQKSEGPWILIIGKDRKLLIHISTLSDFFLANCKQISFASAEITSPVTCHVFFIINYYQSLSVYTANPTYRCPQEELDIYSTYVNTLISA